MDTETKKPPTNEVSSIPLLALVCFLAKYQEDLNALRWKLLQMTPEECKDALMGKWPMIQGTRNQINLKEIGNMDFDSKDVNEAVKQIMANAPC